MRKRKIVKNGDDYFISLSKEDVKDFGLMVEESVDIDDLNMIEQSKEKKE